MLCRSFKLLMIWYCLIAHASMHMVPTNPEAYQPSSCFFLTVLLLLLALRPQHCRLPKKPIGLYIDDHPLVTQI